MVLYLVRNGVAFLESAGALLVVVGLGLWLGLAAALIAAGIGLLAKSAELELRRENAPQPRRIPRPAIVHQREEAG